MQLDHDLQDHRLGRFHVQLSEQPDPARTDPGNSDPVRFAVGDRGLTVSLPLAKAAIVCLGRIWPEAIAVSQLYQSALESLQPPPAADDLQYSIEALHNLLATALAGDMLEIYIHAPQCVSTISQRPTASRVARHQAARRTAIANRWHRGMKLNDLGCFVLQRLDGQHDRGELESDLREALRSGLIVSEREDKSSTVPNAQVTDMVDWALQTSARACLLVG
jgi:methyltransferase-like protein